MQTLPPLTHYNGEESQDEDNTFDRWIERFEERAHLAKWNEEQKLCQFKAHLEKTAQQVFEMMAADEKATYHKAVQALKQRFKPVDIEELRGLEFHQLMQEQQTVEQLGIELQRLGRKAFPNANSKEFDRMLKDVSSKHYILNGKEKLVHQRQVKHSMSCMIELVLWRDKKSRSLLPQQLEVIPKHPQTNLMLSSIIL